MKYPKNSLNYWDEGQKVRYLNWNSKKNSSQISKRLGLTEWFKKGFWKRYYRKKMDKSNLKGI